MKKSKNTLCTSECFITASLCIKRSGGEDKKVTHPFKTHNFISSGLTVAGSYLSYDAENIRMLFQFRKSVRARKRSYNQQP